MGFFKPNIRKSRKTENDKPYPNHINRIVPRLYPDKAYPDTSSTRTLYTMVVAYFYMSNIVPILANFFTSIIIFYTFPHLLLYHGRLVVPVAIFLVLARWLNIYFLVIRIVDVPPNSRIFAYLVLQPQPHNCKTIIFFHGNAGNIGHRLPNAKGLYKHLQANIFLVEYRGYGLSEGAPSESGLYKDSQAALNYLQGRQEIDQSQIILFGRSLGGAVAIDLACRKYNQGEISCLLIENSFTSIPDMAKQLIPWKGLKYIPLWFHKNKFLNKMKIASIQCPVVFISGLSDQLVPPSMMLDLYTQCRSERKLLLQIPNGDHNGTWTKPSYFTEVRLV
nr:EOG090X09ZU [Ilyocryptus agilis]